MKKNKSKTMMFLSVGLLWIGLAHSQESVNTSGGAATGSNASMAYSIGQIDYQTNIGSGGTVSQGVQQPFEIVTLGTNDVPQIQLTATVYPNPTVQNITLAVKDYDITNLEYSLFDMQGRIISKGTVTQNNTPIEMDALAAANYFLRVTRANKQVKTFKIIKK